MKGIVCCYGVLAIVMWAAQSKSESQAAAPHPDATEIMRLAVERCSHALPPPDCQYYERSSDCEFDSKGNLESKENELARVVIRDGLLHSSLLELNGRALSPKEARVREKKDQADEEKLRGHDAGLEDARPQSLLTSELVSRYIFTLVNTENYNGRRTYLLTFVPRPGLRTHRLIDRFFNHIAGMVWIDAQDFELARAEIHLTSDFRLWAGILADVKRCEFTLEETRLPDGSWLTRSMNGLFEARKFLVTTQVVISSEASDYKLLPRRAAMR